MNIIYEPFQERRTGMTWPSLSIHLSHKSKLNDLSMSIVIKEFGYNRPELSRHCKSSFSSRTSTCTKVFRT